jgi:hypothetical protein
MLSGKFLRLGVTVMLGLWLTSPAFSQDPKQQPKDSKSKTTTLTGCVDEQDGIYVLLKGPDRTVVARLQANGFPEDGFAKHLGHTVSLGGVLAAAGDVSGKPPLFKVNRVEKVSDTCQ